MKLYDERFVVGMDGLVDDEDDNFSMNLTDVDEESDFEILPDGDYNFVVENVEYTHSKTSGKPMLKWTLELIETEEGKFDARKIWVYTVLVGCDYHFKVLKKLLKRVVLMNDEDLQAFAPKEFCDMAVALGAKGTIRLGSKLKDGKKEQTQKEFLPYGGNSFIQTL